MGFNSMYFYLNNSYFQIYESKITYFRLTGYKYGQL